MTEEFIEKDNWEEMVIATKAVMPRKAAGPSRKCAKMMSARLLEKKLDIR